MPLELGIDIGCKEWLRRDKSFLILDAEQYRFQKYISDIAGQDIHSHRNDPTVAIRRIRDWLSAESTGRIVSASTMLKRYESFEAALPQICAQLDLDGNDLTFVDLSYAVARWLQDRT